MCVYEGCIAQRFSRPTMCANLLKTTQKVLFKCTAILLPCCLVNMANTV